MHFGRSGLPARFICFLAFACLLTGSASAAELVRGPYVQSTTPSTIVIRWRTDEPITSRVRFGTESNALNQSVIGTAVPVTEHEIRLEGLLPLTRYYYSVGSPDETLASGSDYHFWTHPIPGTDRSTRVWVIGDPGTFATGAGNQVGVRDAYYNFTGSRPTDVWLALGDNAYYDGTDAEYQVNFFNIYSTLMRQTAVWSAVGNHETYSVPFGERIPYEEIFTFPENGEAGGLPSGNERYYSFDYGNIHFVSLDSMTASRSSAGPMAAWLQEDLAANTSKWLIVFFHHPPYTKGSHNSDLEIEHIEMRANVVPILEQYGVDLVLGGHSHIYERSYLINGHYGDSTDLSPTNIVDSGSGRVGDTGAYLKRTAGVGANEGAVYVVAGSSGWATFRTGHHPVMFMDPLVMGSLVLDINTNRLDATFIRETGAIDDTFTIIKGAPAETLRMATFKMAGGETVARWKSVPGKVYQVERASNLESPDWTAVSGAIQASGATSSWTNGIAEGPDRSFYRILQIAE